MRAVSLIVLFPIMVYDFLTSLIGGYALFSLGTDDPLQDQSRLLLHGIPWTLAAGAVVLNYWTLLLWRATENSMRFLRLPWILFLGYDFYTTFLGVAGLLDGAELFAFKFKSIGSVVDTLGTEQIVITLIISCVIVITPMTMYLIKNIGKD